MNLKNRKLGILAAAALGSVTMASPAPALDLGAFMDVSYVSSDAAGDQDNFAIGGLDLYATEKISDKTTAFFEVVYENDGSAFILDVERYSIKREISDAFTIAAGRFHSPLGFWNGNYHHGILIQDTVSRPAFLEFEDGAAATLPMHVIGLMATGNPARGVGYELGISNSSSYDTTSGVGTGEILLGNVDDLSGDKTLFGRVTFAVPGVPLNLGVFAMVNALVEAGTGGSVGVAQGAEIAENRLYGLDLRYEHKDFDTLIEYYSFDNKPGTGVTAGDGNSHDATAYFVQLGYQLTDQFKAVYRYEDLSFDAGDAYFNVLGTKEYSANVFALRYELDDSNAITLEYKDVDSPGSANDVATTTLNWSFLMF